MLKTQAIKTFLPVFPGFYETIYKFDDDNVLFTIKEARENKELNPIDWECMKIDYTQYESDLVLSFCDVMADLLYTFIKKITFEIIVSPKEYNFKNDSVNVIIECYPLKIQEYIYNNKDQFIIYLKNNYTSYDGFISHYDNDFESWEQDTKNFTDFNIDGHRLGSILTFIFFNSKLRDLKDNHPDVYERVTENIYQEGYIENYDDLMNIESCFKCNKLIEDQDTLNMLDKFIKSEQRKPVVLCNECAENN